MLIPVSASFSTRLPFTGAKEPSSRFSRPQLWLVGVENRPERCFAVSSKVGKRTELMVPKKGLEPPHPCGYMDLNHARLPIPPLRPVAQLPRPRPRENCKIRFYRCLRFRSNHSAPAAKKFVRDGRVQPGQVCGSRRIISRHARNSGPDRGRSPETRVGSAKPRPARIGAAGRRTQSTGFSSAITESWREWHSGHRGIEESFAVARGYPKRLRR